jgi:hypothetical protein
VRRLPQRLSEDHSDVQFDQTPRRAPQSVEAEAIEWGGPATDISLQVAVLVPAPHPGRAGEPSAARVCRHASLRSGVGTGSRLEEDSATREYWLLRAQPASEREVPFTGINAFPSLADTGGVNTATRGTSAS